MIDSRIRLEQDQECDLSTPSLGRVTISLEFLMCHYKILREMSEDSSKSLAHVRYSSDGVEKSNNVTITVEKRR